MGTPRRHAFDFEIDASGARVVVVKEPLTSAALSDGELEWQIKALKNDLDALLPEMKKAIQAQRTKPIFEGD